MTSQESVLRFSAVSPLQTIRDRYVPGSYAFDVAAHAIDLVLSPRREVDDCLLRNALRDSRKILSRRRKSAPIIVSLDAIIESAGGEGIDYQELTLHDFCADPCPPPDQLCSARNYSEVLYDRISNSNAAGVALECLEHGDSSTDFVRKTGLSVSYFKKLKTAIRQIAAMI